MGGQAGPRVSMVASSLAFAPPSVSVSHTFFWTLLRDCSAAGRPGEQEWTLRMKCNANREMEKTRVNYVEDDAKTVSSPRG